MNFFQQTMTESFVDQVEQDLGAALVEVYGLNEVDGIKVEETYFDDHFTDLDYLDAYLPSHSSNMGIEF